MFEASDARYIYVRDAQNYSMNLSKKRHLTKAELARQQTVVLITPSRKSDRDSKEFDLWLLCPKKSRTVKRIGTYSGEISAWKMSSHKKGRNLYR